MDRELAKTKIITETPIAGKLWIRRDIFSDDDKKYQEDERLRRPPHFSNLKKKGLEK